MGQAPYVTKTGMPIDPARIKRNGETLMFSPFRVEQTQPLEDALAAREISEDAEMLVAVRDDTRVIGLLRSQMAYHHIAQGVCDDQPWVVFF